MYIVCLVFMSKFESFSNGSTLYFSSHDFFVSHMDLVVLVGIHVVSHLGHVSKCATEIL